MINHTQKELKLQRSSEELCKGDIQKLRDVESLPTHQNIPIKYRFLKALVKV
jgi:hypothetical protein